MEANRSPEAIRNQVTSVPLLDIGRENRPLLDEIKTAIDAVIESGAFVLGPACRDLEENVANLCESKHAIGCASGSDALLLALMAFDIGPGDEVILPSFTFFATASAVWRLGATPVFVDIKPDTFNISPEHIRRALTSKTKAIIPVHLFGQTAAMDEINQIASERGIRVIEDAAQSIGAAHRKRAAGSLGDVACFSFYPTKNLGAFGDGGMLTTNDDELADRLRLLRAHGMRPRYYHSEVGINSRLDSIQAAILNVKMQYLGEWTEKRQRNAQRYETYFREAGIPSAVELPKVASDRYHVFNQYTIRVTDGRRDELRKTLSESNIGSEIYYPVPMHMQECFRHITADPLPVTETASKQVLSLPIFPELTAPEQRAVVEAIVRFFGATTSVPAPHIPTGVTSQSLQQN